MALLEVKGTIKIKDANGQMHPFYPKTDQSCVFMNNGQNVKERIDQIASNINNAESRACIEPMHVEPTKETTKDFLNETLIAWYGDPAYDSEKHMNAVVSTDAMSSPVKVVGDTVSASVVFVNSGNAQFDDASLVVPAFSNAATEQEDIPADPFQNIETTVDYTITEADVLAALTNSGNLAPQNVSVSRSGAQGTVSISGDTAIYLNVYEDNLISEKYEPFLTISRSSWYSANVNERPSYTCAVANNTMTAISNVVLASEGTGWTDTVSFAPGETKYFDIEYPVLTEARLIELNGTLTDTFTANGTSFASTPITASTSISVDPAAPLPNLSISVLSDGKSTVTQDIAEGGTVSYAVTVANTGNVTISNIAVQIAPTIGGTAGTAESVSIGTLAPGASSVVNRSISIPADNASSAITASITSGSPAAGTFNLNSSTLTIKQAVVFKFKAQTLNNKISVPFDLYNNSYSINVDWGDGSTSTLTSSSYSYNYTSAAVHTYSTAGEYTISVSSANWNSIYFDTATQDYDYATSNYTTQHIYYFKNTVTELLSPLPQFYRIRYQQYSGASYRRYYTNSANILSSLFYNCTKLTSIPSNLFVYNTAATSFQSCFCDCSSLQSIPEGLFDSNTIMTTVTFCFYGCTSLQSIPTGLFDKNTAVNSFLYCFYDCRSLQSIPAGLFDKNTAVTSFGFCFYDCRSLQSIPSGLFDKNTAVTGFSRCFQNCTSLQTIPSGLFDKNTAVTTFIECFDSCSSLQSIPAGLFDKNTAVTSFYGCFYNCRTLQSIPSGLFDKNTAVTTFNGCFNHCSSLSDFNIHIGSSLVSNCSNFVTLNSNATRTVYVPSGSTTETTFNAAASTLGLTIIGE